MTGQKKPLENNLQAPAIEKLMRPFQAFIKAETSAGILLIALTIVALIWANSPFAPYYFSLWHNYISIDVAGLSLSYDLHHWINDGLMAVFFFVVGLEIKRELLVGELSTAKKAALPVAGAVGGMLFPAALYAMFNYDGPGSSGWGIPMATDIAFVIGVLALLGSNVPIALKIFVTALAIADDIGAVLVIAFFYTADISVMSLVIGAVFLLLLILSNKLGVRNLLIYSLLGLGLWLAFLKSGIHATVAGVLFAFCIPARARIDSREFLDKGRRLLQRFDDAGEEAANVLTNEERSHIVHVLETNCEKIMTPLQRFEHGLLPWVSFFIIPIFALANAGVALTGDITSSITDPISIGIIVGLFFGKQLGIFLLSWLSIKTNIAVMPDDVSWKQLYGAGILAGIGFTMSLFIANLAFADNTLLNIAKIGILAASLIAGIVGFIMLKSTSKQ